MGLGKFADGLTCCSWCTQTCTDTQVPQCQLMGTGSIFSGSWKQRMVVQSSTESEIIGVYDIFPQVLWMKKFSEDQGIEVKETIL